MAGKIVFMDIISPWGFVGLANLIRWKNLERLVWDNDLNASGKIFFSQGPEKSWADGLVPGERGVHVF
jgi:hypothetical protein